MTKSTRNRKDLEKITLPHQLTSEKSNLDGDRLNIFFLIILYSIQGFLIGFSIALPIILQSNKNVTYKDQALLSIVVWPFSMNILWAPIVDALYVQRIGRRKSWIIFLQLLMVTLLIYLANNIDHWLPETGNPNLKMLVFVIFFLNFLSSTQDIAVDGWSLTMLKKKNVNYSSTCNGVGLPIGMFIGSVCFTLLVSEKFSNKIFQSAPGSGALVTMKSFLQCWAFFVLSVTFFIVFFKKENHCMEDGHEKISVFQNYKLLWNVLRVPGIKVLAVALLTTTFGFIGTDSVTPLKLIESGVSKEDIMMIATAMYTVKFVMPIFVNKYITSSDPMSYYMKMIPYRLLWGIVFAIFVYFTPKFIHNTGVVNVRVYYNLLLGFLYLINEMLIFFMLLTLRAFFCQISDPRFGGTFMTLFNTFYFLGWLVPNTFLLKLVDASTFSECSVDVQNFCTSSDLKYMCKSKGGSCVAYVDGYYLVMLICIIFGFVWYGIFRNIIEKYQSKGLFNYATYNQRYADTKEVNESCIMSPV